MTQDNNIFYDLEFLDKDNSCDGIYRIENYSELLKMFRKFYKKLKKDKIESFWIEKRQEIPQESFQETPNICVHSRLYETKIETHKGIVLSFWDKVRIIDKLKD